MEPVAFKTNSGLNAYELVFVEETTKTVNGKNPIVTQRNKTMYAVDLGVGPALELSLIHISEPTRPY